MAAPARLITLNIGSQTLGLAEFRVIHGRLLLLNYRFREISADPASEGLRRAVGSNDDAGEDRIEHAGEFKER